LIILARWGCGSGLFLNRRRLLPRSALFFAAGAFFPAAPAAYLCIITALFQIVM